MARLIAIGDIHGGSYELGHILKEIDPQSTDTIVTIGDYVDRGIDSKGVLDMLIALSSDCHLVPILGNHDELMLRAKSDSGDFAEWIGIGGSVALESYGDAWDIDLVPEQHFQFLRNCIPFFETETRIFTHAKVESRQSTPSPIQRSANKGRLSCRVDLVCLLCFPPVFGPLNQSPRGRTPIHVVRSRRGIRFSSRI